MHVIVQCEYISGRRGQIALSTGAPNPPNLQGLVLTEEHPPYSLLCFLRSSSAVSEAGVLMKLAQSPPSLYMAATHPGAPGIEAGPPRTWAHGALGPALGTMELSVHWTEGPCTWQLSSEEPHLHPHFTSFGS